MVIVIPCFNETSLLPVFESLQKCALPEKGVEVLAIVNASESTSEQVLEVNNRCFGEAKHWIQNQDEGRMTFHVALFNDLPSKTAGVGLARKIGMDEAIRRFDSIGIDGVIVNLDVDCTVDKNYLVEIERHFLESTCLGAGIYFEHDFSHESEDVQNAIIQYELYLRYFINMQRHIGFPWAYQTIGSAMAVRASVYMAQGGMNKRKAGEDFYFLQKIIELGHFSEINTTSVYPSSRPSDRVPFGTGKAVNDIIGRDGQHTAYAPESFEQLGMLFKAVHGLYEKNDVTEILKKLPPEIREYLQVWEFEKRLRVVKAHTSSRQQFVKRFYREFNAFQLMKYLHWMRDHYFANIDVLTASNKLFSTLNLPPVNSLKDALNILRKIDREQPLSVVDVN